MADPEEARPVSRRPTRAPRDPARRQRGFALLAVLWLVVLLSLIAASFQTETRTETALARNAVENAKAEALADAGVHYAILRLLAPETQAPLAPRTVGRPRPGADPELTDAPGAALPVDGTVLSWPFGAGEVLIAVRDEGGKIDLNLAPDELLAGLFAVLGVPEERVPGLVDAVVDFRDPDDLRRLHGAEDADYRALGLGHGAKDAPFEAVEELRQVPGVTRALYARARPLVTVYTGDGGVDPALAPPEVLLALPGMTEAAVEALLAARGGPDPATGDPAALAGLDASGAGAFLSASYGDVFSILAEGRSAGGGVFVREAVVRLIGGEPPFAVLRWGRAGRRLSAEPVGEGAGEG